MALNPNGCTGCEQSSEASSRVGVLEQRSHHDSVQPLEADIRGWVKDWNTHPKPFIWTKSAEEILESLGRLLKRISGAGH